MIEKMKFSWIKQFLKLLYDISSLSLPRLSYELHPNN